MNGLIERIKKAELGAVIKIAVIVIVGFLLAREVIFCSFVKDMGSTIFGVNSWLSQEQDRVENKFNEQWEKHYEEISSHSNENRTDSL